MGKCANREGLFGGRVFISMIKVTFTVAVLSGRLFRGRFDLCNNGKATTYFKSLRQVLGTKAAEGCVGAEPPLRRCHSGLSIRCRDGRHYSHEF